MIILLLICILAIFLVLIYRGINEKNKYFPIGDHSGETKNPDELINKDLQVNSLFFDDVYKYDKWKVIGINRQNKKMYFYNYNQQPAYFCIPFSSILSSSIKQDGETITQTSNTIGRALIGGVLAGGAGAIVGGMTSKKQNKQLIRKLTLEIVVNDLDNPEYKIDFLNDAKGIDANSDEFKKEKEQVDHWQNLMSVIIEQNKTTPAN